MTYDEVVKKFLEKVQVIKSLNPAYRQPGDGSDGTCDCIGLVIGAIRRMGLKWTGIHGTNWAARKEFVELKQITDESQLHVGDVVLKAYDRGNSKWKLPGRYQQGGKYFNGDTKDYYHAGVVTSVHPLNITHMSSKMTVDKKLGQWRFGGRLKILDRAADEGVQPTPSPAPKPIPSTGSEAVVYAENGLPVKLRQYPSRSCRTWDSIPVGTILEVVAPGEEWCQVNCGRRQGWYMMAAFVDVIGDGRGKY